jgi:hypothetical protein
LTVTAVRPGDDHILPATRWAALAVFVILVPAVIVLWGTPTRTADRWAWTIKPGLTPVFLGAGYGAGAYFFLRTFRARRWHPSSAGVLGASVFAALMLIATLLHWGKFNHGHAPFLAAFAFWGWTIVYIVSPVIVFAIWWLNRATDLGQIESGEAVVGDRVRLAALAFGLAARVLASFTAQVGVGALVLSRERRWSGWRLIVQTFFVASAFLLVGAARRWHDFGPDAAKKYLYLGGLLTADVLLLALYVRSERPSPASGARARAR